MMKQKPDFEKLTKAYREQVLRKTILPSGVLNSRSTHKEDADKIPINCEVPSTNKKLLGSKYYYTESKEFIHYTNIRAITGILREKGVRMYNLKNVNDPREYIFGADVAKISKEQIQKLKDSVYVFSMSRLHYKYKENPVLWRLYGDNGNGCAVVLEIVNDIKNWNFYHLSQVYYNDKQDIDDFYRLSQEFEKNNPVQINYDLTRLVPFHKDDLWRIEDEIRLLAYFENQFNINTSDKKLFFDINKKNERVSYNLLDIVEHSNPTINKYLSIKRPSIKIKEIIIGYNVSDFAKVKNTLRTMLKNNLNYTVKISQSCFYEKM